MTKERESKSRPATRHHEPPAGGRAFTKWLFTGLLALAVAGPVAGCVGNDAPRPSPEVASSAVPPGPHTSVHALLRVWDHHVHGARPRAAGLDVSRSEP